MFSLFNFHPFFSGGSADPICSRTPFVRTPMIRLQRARRYANANTSYNPVSVCQSVSLSQVGVQSKRLNESGWFLAQELPLTCTKLCH